MFKQSRRVALLVLIAVSLACSAETILKITMQDDAVAEEMISELTTIVFANDSLMSNRTFFLADVRKIEFVEGDSVGLHSNNSAVSGLKSSGGRLALIPNGVQLTLPSATTLSVVVYGINGRKVAELFRGSAESGKYAFTLNELSLSSGMYAVVVNMGSTLYAHKIHVE